MKNERIYGFFVQQRIKWKFNLSRGTLVGLFKGSLYKSIGNGLLSWKELQEVLLDVEVALTSHWIMLRVT